jgi:hypothetical protein
MLKQGGAAQSSGFKGGRSPSIEPAGTTTEEELEAIMKGKQALLEKLQLQEDDPLKKLLSNHDSIVKKHQAGAK